MAKKEESGIQDKIMIALSQNKCRVFRQNVGKFLTQDGRWISIGIPGMSDLYGTIEGTGQSFYIETKTPIGKATKEQKNFIKEMAIVGAKTGFARSVEDAIEIIKGASK